MYSMYVHMQLHVERESVCDVCECKFCRKKQAMRRTAKAVHVEVCVCVQSLSETECACGSVSVCVCTYVCGYVCVIIEREREMNIRKETRITMSTIQRARQAYSLGVEHSMFLALVFLFSSSIDLAM